MFSLNNLIVFCRNATWISAPLGESYTSVLWGDAGEFSEPELISGHPKHSGNVCRAQMSPCFS